MWAADRHPDEPGTDRPSGPPARVDAAELLDHARDRVLLRHDARDVAPHHRGENADPCAEEQRADGDAPGLTYLLASFGGRR
jgi:hypothetical protein